MMTREDRLTKRRFEMRKETAYVVAAFIRGLNANAKNTRTDGEVLYLFDQPISMRKVKEGKARYVVNMCGHPTKTTLERLNGLYEMLYDKRPFFTREGKAYMGSLLVEVPTDGPFLLQSIQ